MKSLVLWKLWRKCATELKTFMQMFLKACSILYLCVRGLIMSRIKDILKRAIPVLCVCNSIYINYISWSQNLDTSSNDSDANYIGTLVGRFTSRRGGMDYLSLWPLIRVYSLLETLFCGINVELSQSKKSLLSKYCFHIHNGTLMQIYLGLNSLHLNIIIVLSTSMKDVPENLVFTIEPF